MRFLYLHGFCIIAVVKDEVLNHAMLEAHGYAFSIVSTDALVLKHQAISTHSTD